MTIQELLVRDGYWPNIDGPKRGNEYSTVLMLKADFSKPGTWQTLTATAKVYVPETIPYNTPILKEKHT